MTTEDLQALLEQVARIQEQLEAAVRAGPRGSPRREALAMATAWLVCVRRDLETALSYEDEW
ncbi:MAG: hypothetical protein JXA57_05800 [Armatimonadetes bacterium]|nr:hypothetical protein [Armatimonadota bacterium]